MIKNRLVFSAAKKKSNLTKPDQNLSAIMYQIHPNVTKSGQEWHGINTTKE